MLALGIGLAINMQELVEMSGSSSHAFSNLTNPESIDRFFKVYNKLSKSEQW